MEQEIEELESVRDFKVETIELAGLHSMLEALHLPFGGENKSESGFDLTFQTGHTDSLECLEYGGYADICEKDKKLIHALAVNGDEHSKCIRGVIVYARITAPRYWWCEMDTYRIGTERLASNSTMHQQGKGLDTLDLINMKSELKEGTMQTRIQYFSYQTLRRIYLQRKHHRLPQWHKFCDWIEQLPYAKEWITFEK